MFLELEDVHVSYGPIAALRGISLSVEEGEIVTLIGANGAGKSTTLNTVSGLLHPRSGRILFRGAEIQRLSPQEVVARGITQVPEGRRVFAEMSVEENLLLGAFQRRDGAGVQRDLAAVYERFPVLAERRRQAAGTLSGGEQQMLAIGRALMARPALLLMDEPSMGLSPILVQQVFEIIRQINAQGTTILLVEQNAHMALKVAHRGYVLETGRIALHGPAAELGASEQVRSAYLGAG
ncbi:MAG: ABC transporter ATP-binding protein [Clostridia bacterium]|nr:ABC transporter ATP-binding protein [Clostridia bacterium]MCL6522854.1 ABC transporter ATP-binding protein [Bacillota bacterium]